MIGSVLMGQRGQYLIQSKIDEGAYGIVYKAINSDSRNAAIKILLDDENQDARDRMIREIQIVIRLKHENIIQILDFGVGPNSASWFAMPLMEAGSLAKLLARQDKRFTAQQALSIVRSIAAGLDVYHKHDGIHRDIKPENILIDNDGTPKLADFGVARCPRLTQGNMTRSALGTPNYMAPEASQGGTCRQSDIYSLGIVLWELIHWRRHTVPLVPPIFAVQISQNVINLYKTMIHIDPRMRPDAHTVASQCRLLSEQIFTPVVASDEPARNESSSPWKWLLTAAVGLVALGAATSNDWDGRSNRYRGRNGQFRSGRWG